MSRASKITFAAAGVVVAGLVALAVIPLAGSASAPPAAAEPIAVPLATSTAAGTPPDLTVAHREGGARYDAYVSEGRLLLPPGYAWLSGEERRTVPDEARRLAWFDWIAAHADAARGGDGQAATDLKTHIRDVPLEGAIREEVVGLAQGGAASYTQLREMFPLPDGMKFNDFRVDLGPGAYANGTAVVDGEGRLRSYTVAPGDTLYAIAQRFSVRVYDLSRSIGHTLQPGDIVGIR